MDQATIDRLSEAWLPAGALGAAAAIVLAALWLRQPVGDWPFVGGLLLGVAAGADDPPTGLAVGCCAAVAIELTGRRLGDRAVDRIGRAGVAVAAALVIAGVGRSLVPVLAGAALVAVAAIADLDERRPGLFPVLLAITVAGTWATVPDTEEATALLGAAIVVALVSVRARLRAERVGTVLALVAVLATIGFGGVARDGAVVGATVALLSLAAAPLVERWTSHRAPTLAVVLVHVAVVAVATRIGGVRTAAAPAAVIGLAGLALGIGALALVATRLGDEVGA
ncbi:MAG: hypothetical protein AAFZ07_19130 [Actinomycetota bacterium]